MIDIRTPMGAARYVRRACYAWPGGYPLALVTADGGLLCPSCVKVEFSQISYSHRHAISDGWRPAGVICFEEPSEGCCDHCNKPIYPDN